MTFGLNMAGTWIQLARVWHGGRTVRRTSSNGKNVNADKEGNLGGAILNEGLGTTSNDENVSNAANDDAPEDHGEAAEPRVGEVSDHKRETVRQQAERLGRGVLFEGIRPEQNSCRRGQEHAATCSPIPRAPWVAWLPLGTAP